MTASGGHVGVLDAGNFGSFAITKALSITNDGPGEARVTIRRADAAIYVLAGRNDRVYLRGLTIDGLEGGVVGIHFSTGAALHIQNCTIQNFRQPSSLAAQGIVVEAAAESEVYISDTLIAGNGDNPTFSFGLAIVPGANGSAKVALNRVQINDNANGVLADGSSITRRPEVIIGRPIEQVRPLGVLLTVRDSMIAGNTGIAVVARSIGFSAVLGLATRAIIDRTTLVSNGVGVLADGGRANVRLLNSTIVANGTGVSTLNVGHVNYDKPNTISDNRLDYGDTPSGF